MLQNPEKLNSYVQKMMVQGVEYFDHWEKPAALILTEIQKRDEAMIFVTCATGPTTIGWDRILELPGIRKEKIDFYTIEQNIKNFMYKVMEQWVEDIFIVLDNAIFLNMDQPEVVKKAKIVH